MRDQPCTHCIDTESYHWLGSPNNIYFLLYNKKKVNIIYFKRTFDLHSQTDQTHAIYLLNVQKLHENNTQRDQQEDNDENTGN